MINTVNFFLTRQKIWILLIFLLLSGVACAVLSPKDPTCQRYAIKGVKLCLPSEYVWLSYAPDGTSNAIHIKAPAQQFPILPAVFRNGNFKIDLQEKFSSLVESRQHAIDSYNAIHRISDLESGMIVMRKDLSESAAFGHDILYPINNDQVYFLCARPWTSVAGEYVDVFCEANVDLNQSLSNPRVSLSFYIYRSKIQDWKNNELLVRDFLKSHSS